MSTRQRVAVALVATATLLCAPGPAQAQDAADVATVSVAPTDVRPDGPNGGRWFAQELAPGQSARTSAVLTNTGRVAQTVQIYARDLRFGPEGTPDVIDDPPVDVGAWVRSEVDRTTLGPGESRTVGFSVTVAQQAEPGDHIGVLVVESTPLAGAVSVVKRVATRLYVTVPGEATRAIELADVTRRTVGGLFPRLLEVEASLRNTGRIRVEPQVSINGRPATGSDVLLSQSVELYEGAVPIPWYGGRIPVTVEADAGGGLLESRRDSVFVVPWALIAIVLLVLMGCALLLVAVRTGRRRRRAEVAQLQAELRRLQDQATTRT